MDEKKRWAISPSWQSIRDEWERFHPDWTEAELDAKADDLWQDYLESRYE